MSENQNLDGAKRKWSTEEFDKFLQLEERFGNDYAKYVPFLHRSHNSIKGFYHNLKRQGLVPSKDARSKQAPSAEQQQAQLEQMVRLQLEEKQKAPEQQRQIVSDEETQKLTETLMRLLKMV